MKLVHMSKMFQMYATQDFSNGVDLWLAGICRYLNDAYPPLSVKVCMVFCKVLFCFSLIIIVQQDGYCGRACVCVCE